jgi:hypothetical protein
MQRPAAFVVVVVGSQIHDVSSSLNTIPVRAQRAAVGLGMQRPVASFVVLVSGLQIQLVPSVLGI